MTIMNTLAAQNQWIEGRPAEAVAISQHWLSVGKSDDVAALAEVDDGDIQRRLERIADRLSMRDPTTGAVVILDLEGPFRVFSRPDVLPPGLIHELQRRVTIAQGVFRSVLDANTAIYGAPVGVLRLARSLTAELALIGRWREIMAGIDHSVGLVPVMYPRSLHQSDLDADLAALRVSIAAANGRPVYPLLTPPQSFAARGDNNVRAACNDRIDAIESAGLDTVVWWVPDLLGGDAEAWIEQLVAEREEIERADERAARKGR